MESDVTYFSRRASEERQAAEHAGHPKAREAHLELASRYDEMATAIGRSTAQVLELKRAEASPLDA
jgi:hypothetical protein